MADELLEDRWATEMAIELFAQLLFFDAFQGIAKEDPVWSEALNVELEEAARGFIRRI